MKLKANRLILFVKDAPKVAAFYRDVMGLKINGDADDKKWIDVDAGGFSIGLHGGGKPVSAAGRPKLAFYAKDVAGARERLVERGAKLGKLMSFGELRFCDGKDPEGNLFQLSNRL